MGASSAIAQASARLFAESGDEIFLIARDADKLKVIANDLQSRGANKIGSAELDATDYQSHKAVIKQAIDTLGGIDVFLIAHGTLPDQKKTEQSQKLTRQELEINALSIIDLLTRMANYFEERGQGTIVVISSVAGDRGRQSNYVYGAAKGMLTIFLQGLRNRLFHSGVHVITIKPGFVDTPMTREFKKGFLWASPEKVAKDIQAAIKKKKDVVYTPWFWRYIMMIINAIPETLFKRLKL